MLGGLDFKNVKLKKAETKEKSLADRLSHDDSSMKALKEVNEIVDSLFLTSRYGLREAETISELKITHALCVAKELKTDYAETFEEFKRVELMDRPEFELGPHLQELVDWIHEALGGGKRVVVYCAAGQSRSASVILAYLIRKKDMTLDQALELVREKRPVIEPNPGFLEQLKTWSAEAGQEAGARSEEKSAEE